MYMSKYFVYCKEIEKFINMVGIFKIRCEVHYNFAAGFFVCDIEHDSEKECVLFQNLFVTFFSISKYVPNY